MCTEDALNTLIANGLLEVLKENIYSKNALIVENTIWALSNVIAETPNNKLLFMQLDIYRAVLQAYHNFKSEPTILRIYAWFVSNTLKQTPFIAEPMVS